MIGSAAGHLQAKQGELFVGESLETAFKDGCFLAHVFSFLFVERRVVQFTETHSLPFACDKLQFWFPASSS